MPPQPEDTIFLLPRLACEPPAGEDQRANTRAAFDLLRRHLEACAHDPAYRFLLPDLDCLRPYFAVFAEDRDRLRQLLREGRVETGGFYSPPDQRSLQGEALLRDLLYGLESREALLGGRPATCFLLETPHHCFQLPQLLARAGLRACVSSDHVPASPTLCWQVGPDGSRLLSKRIISAPDSTSQQRLQQTAAGRSGTEAQLGLSVDFKLLGGRGEPPPAWLIGHCRELARLRPRLQIGTAAAYLDALEEELSQRSLPLPFSSRSRSSQPDAGPVLRPDLKIANRLAENSLLAAERFATIALLLGAGYPELALDRAWRILLFNHRRGAISGDCSDTSYLDLLSGYREALELSRQALDSSLRYLCRHIATADAKVSAHSLPVVVFNPLSWPRTDVCRVRLKLEGAFGSGFRLQDPRGREVRSQLLAHQPGKWAELLFLAEDVPSLGYRTYYLRPASHLPPFRPRQRAARASIENRRLALAAEEASGGGLISLFDKKARRELLDPESRQPANQLVAFAVKPGEAAGLRIGGEKWRSASQKAEVELERGPVMSRLLIHAPLPPGGELFQEARVYSGLSRIDLSTELRAYRGRGELLALSFPLRIRGGAPIFEDPFSAVVGPSGCGPPASPLTGGEAPSGWQIEPAQNWVDYGPALSFVWKPADRECRLPLGPCAVISSAVPEVSSLVERLVEALAAAGLASTPYLDSQEFTPQASGWSLRLSLGETNACSLQALAAAEPEARARFEADLRRQGFALLLTRDRSRPEECSLPTLVVGGNLERAVGDLCEQIRAGAISLAPEQVALEGEAAADDYGLALINRGPGAAAVEAEGRLLFPLLQAPSDQQEAPDQVAIPRSVLPEHSSHRFEYSLLPHTGDWKQAALPRAGWEVNFPLQVVIAELSSGPLPTTHSFLTLEPDNLILAALKPAGNPLAKLRRGRREAPEELAAGQQDGPPAPVVVRFYESQGRPAAGRLSFWLPPRQAWKTDLREEVGEEIARSGRRKKGGGLSFKVEPWAIETVKVALEPFRGERAAPGEGAPPRSPVPAEEQPQPIYLRPWDHNLGPAPPGNQPLTVAFHGRVPLGATTRFGLTISHDRVDREVSGHIQISAPAGWRLTPTQVPYRLPPGGQAVYEIAAIVPAGARPGFIRAEVDYEGQRYFEVLEVGEMLPLEGRLLRSPDGGFTVLLTNPNGDAMAGEVILITPLQSWGQTPAAPSSPWRLPFRLGAGEEASLHFPPGEDPPPAHVVAKVVACGQVAYLRP
jgi:hypothetical protein